MSIDVALPQFEIIPSEAIHVKMLADRIRSEDAREILGIGYTPHRAIMKSFKASLFPTTAFVDGEIAAMWGVVGNPLGNKGMPWLMTTDTVYKVSSLRFARVYHREVKRMLRIFKVLENYVDSEYNGAVRLLDICGFSLDDPEPYGPNGRLFRRFYKVNED